jgi:protein-S-isoprenylcysteine O-methyltransferase Ste14
MASIPATTFLSLPHDLPALLVGLILAFYWWRVVRMAYKLRRKIGKAANFVPPESLGRALRWIWRPVVAIWVVHPLLNAFLVRPPIIMRPLFSLPILRWPAVVIALLALLATRVCWRRMGKSWRMGIDPNERTNLIFTGPYAYVRHPIYALSTVLMIATMIVLPSPLMLCVGVIHLMLLQWEARREEMHLSRIHGEPYDRYRAAVGGFFPRALSKYSPSAAT